MNRKIVANNIKRSEIQQKIKEALAKKPTASFINCNTNLNNKIEDHEISEQTKKFINERLIKNSKNRKRYFAKRPEKVAAQTTQGHLNDPPIHLDDSHEYPTPIWFRNTEQVDVSVIVPIYKSGLVIADLINNWPLESKLKYEIIFVEDNCPNNCKDNVLKLWDNKKNTLGNQKIGKIIYNRTNKGYGVSCNIGSKFALGKYLIFLNADTQVTPNWIEPMIKLFDDPTVGLVGNLQLKQGGNLHGTIDSAGSEWRWPDMAFVHIGRHSYKKGGLVKPMKPDEAPKDIMQVGEREMVTGCCFAMKASLFKYIGGFNHNYRIGYWEDSEICMNVRELGYKILFTPESVIYHKLGHTGSGGHNYFNQNRNYFFNKWVKSNRIHKLLIPPEEPKDKLTNILIKRTSAHGDVLVASGVCAALKQQHPGIKITFCTNFQEVIQDNPYIDEFVEISKKPSADIVYNLDMVYEMRPQVNILDAYAEYCGVNKKDCDVFLNQKSMNIDLPENFIVIHAGKTDWAGRDWPHERFIEIANQLLESGEKIIAVGKYSEGEIPCTINLKGKTNIAELAWVMKQSKLFIGIDSFPMHVAQAVDIPGVCFFGSIKPELRIYNEKMHGITANNLDCLGCHHKKFGSTVTKICENGTLACIKNVSSEDMMKKIREIIS